MRSVASCARRACRPLHQGSRPAGACSRRGHNQRTMTERPKIRLAQKGGGADLRAREKNPGMAVEEAKAGLRIEETDLDAEHCESCATARAESGDPTTYCAEHLR